MNAEQFAYWLQGFVELNGHAPTPEQWQSIKDHLQLVFKKVTPQVGAFPPSPIPDLRGPFMPMPVYEPRITCEIRPGEQPSVDAMDFCIKTASVQDFKNRGH